MSINVQFSSVQFSMLALEDVREKCDDIGNWYATFNTIPASNSAVLLQGAANDLDSFPVNYFLKYP